MPGFLSPRKGKPLLLIPEYSGINKGQRVPDRYKTAHRKPFVKCFLTHLTLQQVSVDPHFSGDSQTKANLAQSLVGSLLLSPGS